MGDLAEIFRTKGWDRTKPPVEVLENPDGTFTSYDNRRIEAAKMAGNLKDIPVRVFERSDPIPPEFPVERIKPFTKHVTDPYDPSITYKKGEMPTTMGGLVTSRSADQGTKFPLTGIFDRPTVKNPK